MLSKPYEHLNLKKTNDKFNKQKYPPLKTHQTRTSGVNITSQISLTKLTFVAN